MMTILTNIEEDRGGGGEVEEISENDETQLLNKSNSKNNNNNVNSLNKSSKYIKLEQEEFDEDISNRSIIFKQDDNNYDDYEHNNKLSFINEDNENQINNSNNNIKINIIDTSNEKEEVEEVKKDIITIEHIKDDEEREEEEEDQFYQRPFSSDLLISDKSITNRVKSVERGMNKVTSFRDINNMLSNSMEIKQNLILSAKDHQHEISNDNPNNNHNDSIISNDNNNDDNDDEEEFEDITLEKDSDDEDITERKPPLQSPFKQLLAMKFKSLSSQLDNTPMTTLISGVDVVPVHHKEKYLTFPSSQLMSTLASNGKPQPNQYITSSPLNSNTVIPSSSSSPFKFLNNHNHHHNQSSNALSPTSTPSPTSPTNISNSPKFYKNNNNNNNLSNTQNFTSMPNLFSNINNSASSSTSNNHSNTSYGSSSISSNSSIYSSSSLSSNITTSSTTSTATASSTHPTTHFKSMSPLPNNISASTTSTTNNATPQRKMSFMPYDHITHSESGSISTITRPVLSSETNKIGSKLIFLLACSVFFSVSNLYYIQPLINLVGDEFNVGPTVMSLVTMAVQAGYAVGLLFISTLGDIISKKRLILILSAFTCISLIGVALSYHIAQMIIFQFIVGCSTIIPHIAIPLAIDLSTPAERNSIIGILMSVLFVGLLGARVLSGIIAEFLGWRSVYYIASVIMFIISLFLFISLPYIPRNQNPIPYTQLLKSIFNLFKLEPALKQTCFIGSMIFGTFSILWTTLSFQLNQEPFRYSSGFIGLFGLIGMAGAIAAPIAGKLSYRISISVMIVSSLLICVLGYIILLLFGNHLVAIIAGIFVLDLGVQACHITNQSRNHEIIQNREEEITLASSITNSTAAANSGSNGGANNQSNVSSYINAAYMASYFIGGAFGSGVCGIVFDLTGWIGSSIFAMVLLGVALSAHLSLYSSTNEHKKQQLQQFNPNDDNSNFINDDSVIDIVGQQPQSKSTFNQNQQYYELQEI